MSHPILLWGGFNLLVLLLLILDLGVFQRKAHEIRVREALLLSAFWIMLALAFNVGVYFWRGRQAALEYLTGYLLEKSLSVDNLFVFLLIFSYFKVPEKYQHQVLFWGILGALIFRAIFILGGIALLERVHWVIYLFGAFLIFTGVKLAFGEDKEIEPERNPVLRLFRRLMPVTEKYEGGKFFLKNSGRLFATPLFVVVLVVETTDIVFAVDSIPAILAITRDSFIVYSSNVFAILGLRALYFALAGMMRLFRHLHYGLALVLVFVGVKMLISHFYKIPVGLSLGVIAVTLAASVMTSLLFPTKKGENFH